MPLCGQAVETVAIRYADEMRAARALVRYAAEAADEAHSEAVQALIRYAAEAADEARSEVVAAALARSVVYPAAEFRAVHAECAASAHIAAGIPYAAFRAARSVFADAPASIRSIGAVSASGS